MGASRQVAKDAEAQAQEQYLCYRAGVRLLYGIILQGFPIVKNMDISHSRAHRSWVCCSSVQAIAIRTVSYRIQASPTLKSTPVNSTLMSPLSPEKAMPSEYL